MSNKIIITFIILYFSNPLMSMETETWRLDKTFENQSRIHSVRINPSEDMLAVVPYANEVQLIELKSGKKMAFLTFNHGITSTCFSHDSTKLAALSDKKTSIYNITKDNNKLTYSYTNSFHHQEGINDIYYDNNQNLLGIETNRKDNTIHITNLKTGNEKNEYKLQSWATISTISSLGNLLATGSGHNIAHLFDANKKSKLNSFFLDSSVSAFAFDSSEKLIAIATRDNKVHIFELEEYEKITTLEHDQLIFSMCFGTSGNLLVTGTSGGKIHVFVKDEVKIQ